MYFPRAASAGSLLLTAALLSRPPAARGARQLSQTPSPESLRVASSAKLKCTPGSVCAPEVGMLATLTAKGVGRCTATLVAPNIALTAGHCLPEDLRTEGASCAGRIWMHFAAAPGHPDYEATLGCAEVISSRGGEDGLDEEADIAFLRLQRSSRRPVAPLSRSGFPDGDATYLDVVNPVSESGNVLGRQKRITCRAVQHSFIVRSFRWDQAKVPLFSDCTVIKGNSGSALRDRAGRARGVIASLRKSERVVEALAFNNFYLAKGAFQFIGLGTNISCLDLPAALAAGPLPAECEEGGGMNLSVQKREDAINAQMAFYEARNRAYPAFDWFRWKVSSTDKAVALEPTCVSLAYLPQEREAAAGYLRFDASNEVDAYGRFRALSLRAEQTEPSFARVTPSRAGLHSVQIGARNYRLPPCAPAEEGQYL